MDPFHGLLRVRAVLVRRVSLDRSQVVGAVVSTDHRERSADSMGANTDPIGESDRARFLVPRPEVLRQFLEIGDHGVAMTTPHDSESFGDRRFPFVHQSRRAS